MIAVFKHELRGYLHSLTAYIFWAAMLVFIGIGTMLYNLQVGYANFELVLSFASIGLCILIPIITMRSIAEEKRQKTDQLLYSLPLSMTKIVMGKFLAVLVVYLIPMLVMCIYPLVLAQFGDVYLLTSYGSLLAFFLMGAALIAVGIFISSLTENQGFAAGISIAVFFLNYFLVTLAEYTSTSAFGSLVVLCIIWVILGLVIDFLTKNDNVSFGIAIILVLATGVVYFIDSTKFESLIPNVMSQISLFDRFSTIVNGVFDLTVIVYYITVIIFFLFLTVQSLEKRRYN